VSLPNLALHLPAHLQARLPWRPAAPDRWRTLLAAVGVPVGVGVGIYTGVLLGAIPARPFWNTPMVAQLFLFSGLSSGSALLLLLLPRLASGDELGEARQALLGADAVFILVELFVIAPFIIHGELSTRSARESLSLILGGPLTAVFWIGVVLLGLLLPLIAEVAALFGRGNGSRMLHLLETAAAILVLVGGGLLRWVFVTAGQLSHFA
jgi:formate-dependent nitrite reductase membrane component NrfD